MPAHPLPGHCRVLLATGKGAPVIYEVPIPDAVRRQLQAEPITDARWAAGERAWRDQSLVPMTHRERRVIAVMFAMLAERDREQAEGRG